MKNCSASRDCGTLVCLLLTGVAGLGGSTNRYSVIAQKNPFALKASSPATNSPPLSAVAPVKIQLAGLADIPPLKWAVLKIQEPGKPAVMLTLKEGCREGPVEILEVDAKAQRIRIRNAGAVMTLTLEDDAPLQKTALARLEAEHRPVPVLPPSDAGDL